jgi:MYXO-CTERM domain-containing protein
VGQAELTIEKVDEDMTSGLRLFCVRLAASVIVFSSVAFATGDALAELPEAIVFQAPNDMRGEWWPNPGLILASDGKFYGTTRGYAVGGTVYRLSSDGTAYATLFPFSSNEVIYSGLVEGPDGNLYGTIYSGEGSIAKGAVFSLSKTGVLTTLHSFTGPDGANPAGPVAISADGTIYGTTLNGGADVGDGFGTIFKLDATGKLTTIYDFGVDDGAVGGAKPRSNLLLMADGTLYGTTKMGGQFDGGTVFRIMPNGQLDAVAFGDTHGSGPHDLLLACGSLYGRAFGGSGLIFKLSPAMGVVSTLHGLSGSEGKFEFSPPSNYAGDDPANGGGLILGTNGKLYGVAQHGSTTPTINNGTVFELGLDGAFMVLYTFKATPTDGQLPWGIAQGSDGTLFGTGYGNGQGFSNGGGIFKLTVPAGFNTPVACPPTVTGAAGAGQAGQDGATGAGGRGGADAGASAGTAGTGGGAGTAAGGSSGTAGSGGAAGATAPAKSGGCSCATAAAEASPGWVFLTIALVAFCLSRRRNLGLQGVGRGERK